MLFLGKTTALKGVCTILAALLWAPAIFAQADSTQSKRINIVYGGNFTKDESLRPGASIFSRDNRQVQFEHQGKRQSLAPAVVVSELQRIFENLCFLAKYVKRYEEKCP